MSKKDIDKLFQEKLKDFHEIPDERVWKSIETSLDQRKKSRRVIPIWWRLGGVAALLAIALLIYVPFDSDLDESSITDRDDPATVIEAEQGDETDALSVEPSGTDALVESSVANESGTDTIDANSESLDSSDINQLAGDTDSEESSQTAKAMAGSEEESLAVNNDNKDPANPSGNEADKSAPEADAIAVNRIDNNKSEQPITAVTKEDNKELGVGVTENNLPDNTNSELVEQSPEDRPENADGKKSIFDEINGQEEEAVTEKAGNRWSVGPSVAPVYFNSFGEGSPIHSNFVSNSKSGNLNLSYGVAVGYEISDKIKIRSGIHKVDYGYDTNDITFSSSLVSSTSTQISNINYTNTSRSLVVESNSGSPAADPNAINDIIAQSPTRSGNMVQEFGYIEVPLELNYSLLDRKFNIDLIGGLSSLFLVNNTVILESEGTSTEMGEANNINDLNFSTNVGVGMNYELSDNMKVHLEPMFKYQLNTFSGTEGNFRPYSLGVYTGLSFKF